jgi:hypothetical protein
MKRYLARWLSLTALLIGAAAALNIVADPYRLYRDDEARAKPKAGANGAVAKAYAVLRAAPAALILGNSRAEVGFDPRHAAWPPRARPAYNLALPGTGVDTSLAYLRHALAMPGARVSTVVLGLDVQDYLIDARAAEAPEVADARLLGAGASAGAQALRRLRDYGQATLTLGALLDSVQTLGGRRDPLAADLDARGFNPMRDYTKIAADEGYWALFRQKDLANSRAYLRRPMALDRLDGREGAPLAQLRQIIALCRERRIELRLVIYPYHAHLLEIIDATGHWEAFEQWKRRMAAIATATGVPLWDFAGFDAFTTETVPAQGDRRTSMRWYWEAGHFKKELGDLVLTQVLGERQGGERGAAANIGTRLEAGNVEARLEAVRAQRAAYRTAHAGDLREIAVIVAAQRGPTPSGQAAKAQP